MINKNANIKLKIARIKAHMTQAELAERVGISRQAMSNIESGRAFPKFLTAIKISNVLCESLDDLFRNDEPHL